MKVLSVIYQSKEQARDYERGLGENAYLLEGFETNPLPDSFYSKA